MKHKMWPAIYAVFKLVEESAATIDTSGIDDNSINAYEPLLELRKKLRTSLLQLKKTLSSNMIERDVYYVLFPIVVYLDEKIQLDFFQLRERSWALLQQEFFEIENGGVMFYDALDNILKNEDTPPLVHEVFFLCLNSGFQGQHTSNPSRIDAYIEILKNKIPVANVTKNIDSRAGKDVILPTVSPRWLYAGSFIIFLLIYLSIVCYHLSIKA